jgi:hypothetical protein
MARAVRRRAIEPPVELATPPEPEAPTPPEPAGPPPMTNEERIARLAYERFQMRGGGHGHDQDDWFAAEREVKGPRSE